MNRCICFLACFTLLFCLSASHVSARDSVKVGIILSLTGAQAAFGEIEKNSFEMALQKVNAAGGSMGSHWSLSMPMTPVIRRLPGR